MDDTEKVITGWWNGEPIWRRKTAEDKLADFGISETTARLGVGILGDAGLSKAILKIEIKP